MEKRNLYVIIGVVAIIAILLILRIMQQPEDVEFFTEEPESWIEENYITEAKDYRISVMKATNGESIFSGNKQEFDNEAFFSFGSYKGNEFRIAHLDAEFYEKNLPENQAHNYKIMEINNYLDPGDNIIQGFIMAKRDNLDYIFYIFVDEDWKNQVEFTNIVYGRDFTASLKFKQFKFNQIKPGIYIDKIDDDKWYNEDPITGGIIVGEFMPSDLKLDKINSTFIMLR